MISIDGEHVQAVTGKVITYRVDMDPGPESTYYAARVLLSGATWHELEGGTVTGPDQNARSAAVMQEVFAQVDGLDFDALNRS